MDEHELMELIRAYLERCADPSSNEPDMSILNAEVRHTPSGGASFVVQLSDYDGGATFVVSVTQIGGE